MVGTRLHQASPGYTKLHQAAACDGSLRCIERSLNTTSSAGPSTDPGAASKKIGNRSTQSKLYYKLQLDHIIFIALQA